MSVLAIIPARAGSHTLPKKNIRLLHGKPLISYMIELALSSPHIDAVYVSTDSEEIASVAKSYGAKVIFRGASLSGDSVTLDPVIAHAVSSVENIESRVYDTILTLQPTSPLLKRETLESALIRFLDENLDTLVSVVNQPRLSWGTVGSHLRPLYKNRQNRQDLPPQYRETGAFLITKRAFITEISRFGKNVDIAELSTEESVDIREKTDWILAEHLLGRKRIIFRADGYVTLGMGHIYNCITMAYSLMMEHDVLLLLHERSTQGIQKVEESRLPYRIIHDETEIWDIIEDYKPHIWVNDCLDTTADYILHLKQKIPRVVTIEDLGTGSLEADAVINALYNLESNRSHVYCGYKYVCLREEFLLTPPAPFSPEVHRVVIMFGGTDPSNLNERLYKSILLFSEKYREIEFQFITGIGYDAERHGVETNEEKHIFVYKNVPRVSEYLAHADLAITSQGRAIFELAAMGVPAIVLSQNPREQTHRFAQLEHGFVNLGIGDDVDSSVIEHTLDWLINTKSVRRNMRELMVAFPLRQGIDRVKRIILGIEENYEN